MDSIDAFEQFSRIEDRYIPDIQELGRIARNIEMPTDERIDAINRLRLSFSLFTNECKASSPSVWKCYSDLYLHCHNSDNSDFRFITQYEELLKRLMQNKTDIENNRLFMQNNAPTIGKQVLDAIRSNPGIKQSALYLMFDQRLKDVISKFLYFSSKANTITREKVGNTYCLWVKNI